eukprot:TRINITY_DN6990_c0_g1_i6.p1 TRINITY_DN6990_c0_g1~~TRINITY_DN6990_c0_g1_i6.p1  ORF type:complete len:624 (+),score=86.56 TRINITY_DN6990_c0_g1_i6:55-1926(+)
MHSTTAAMNVPSISDVLPKHAPVDPASDEFIRAEQMLQLALQSPLTKLKSLWIVCTNQQAMQYEKRCKGMLVLDSWVETETLREPNTVAELAHRGFRIPQGGLLFPTGAIEPRYPIEIVSHGSRSRPICEYLVSRVAVGRAYCLEEDVAVDSTPRVLPEGYQSIYVHQVADTKSAEVPNPFIHEYLVMDANQVLPKYLMHFEYDPKGASRKPIIWCEVCEQAAATIYCSSDDAKLCAKCDSDMHSANKLMSRHIRIPIDQRPDTFGYCPSHPKQGVEFWCGMCQIPVCVHCKMVGSHSSGDNATHKLVHISDAYRTSLSDSMKVDPIVQERRISIMGQLSQIDSRLREVNTNSASLEEALYALLQSLLHSLREETKSKLAILLGDELELRRQLENMEWMDEFVKKQQELLPPVDFLTSWYRYAKFRQELAESRGMKPLTDVQPDMMLVGRVQVSTQEKEKQKEHLSQRPSYITEDRQDLVGTPSNGMAPSQFRSYSSLEPESVATPSTPAFRTTLTAQMSGVHLGSTGPSSDTKSSERIVDSDPMKVWTDTLRKTLEDRAMRKRMQKTEGDRQDGTGRGLSVHFSPSVNGSVGIFNPLYQLMYHSQCHRQCINNATNHHSKVM